MMGKFIASITHEINQAAAGITNASTCLWWLALILQYRWFRSFSFDEGGHRYRIARILCTAACNPFAQDAMFPKPPRFPTVDLCLVLSGERRKSMISQAFVLEILTCARNSRRSRSNF